MTAKKRSAERRSAKDRSATKRSVGKAVSQKAVSYETVSPKPVSLSERCHGEGYFAGRGAFVRFLLPPLTAPRPFALQSFLDCEPVQPGFPTRRASLAPGSETTRNSFPILVLALPRYCSGRIRQLVAFGWPGRTSPVSEIVELSHKSPQRGASSVARPEGRGIAGFSYVDCTREAN